MNPDDWLLLCRTVRFGDTDAAGVMHFHQLLRWCHEAWEESLERYGVTAAEIFPAAAASGAGGQGPATSPAVALPIVHCSADYRRPLRCGDPLTIRLQPLRIDPMSFEVQSRFSCGGEEVARGRIRHLAIDAAGRQRRALPEPIQRWLEASSLAGGIQPL
ncbi:MAG: thioesterase family protein [Cyanobacteriota bacterium]|nr:thioesterase family protein [Cyanobacteriota bacterium]